MAVRVLLFLFMFFLLSLAPLWRLGWLHLQTSSSRAGAIHSTVQRLLKIHPLFWRSEIFELTHQLRISNRAEVVQRRGTRK